MRVAVQLITAADEPVDGLPVTIVATGPGGAEQRAAELPQCGPGCYQTRADLDAAGVWSFTISAGERGVNASIPLPTPDGTAVFQGLRRAFDELRSLRIQERFQTGTGLLLDTIYLLEEPDRFEVKVRGGRGEIAIGRRGFRRSEPGASWEQVTLTPLRSGPIFFLWTRIEHVRLLEDTTVDGRPAWTLALFDPFGIWYRVVVDKQTMRPISDRMRAIGHFMDRTYSLFDQDLGIEAPPNAQREETG